MKKFLNAVRWIFAVTFILVGIGSGGMWSTILICAAGLLLMPLSPIKQFMKRYDIKTWVVTVVAIVLFFAGNAASPKITQPADNTQQTDAGQSAENQTVDKEESTEQATENEQQPSQSQAATQPQAVGQPSATNVSPSSLPAYSSSPYVIVNNNEPYFSSQELTTASYENYSELDSLGRCGVTIASIGKDIMPTEERGSIGQVKPTGWHTVKYDNVDGKYLYNRCHLIGYQLTGENANTRNLITGTRYLNVEGMLPFENMVADFVKETGYHVAYRVTPIFEGDNLLASGVQIEAYSIEDSGDGICFNVYCYNVQPGISISYADGTSSEMLSQSDDTQANAAASSDKTESKTESTTQPETQQPAQSVGQTVYDTPTGKRYHYSKSCAGDNAFEITLQQAQNKGKTPCKKCVE